MSPPASMLELGLFTGAPQHTNFARLHDLLPSTTIPASSSPREWPEGDPLQLPETYRFDGTMRPTKRFLAETDTTALLVLRDGRVRLERYTSTGGRRVRWISMSVAKSVVSALVGIAVSEGAIGGIEEPISRYVPVESGSAYDGVAIRDVLQMSSGARWNEDYSDPDSDVFRLGAALAGQTTMDEFVATMTRESEPGTVCRYNSGDTQALGALVIRATGRPLSEYTAEKLTGPLGSTDPAHWLVDRAGVEMAYAGLNMTARDFARIGELYRLGGVWEGRRILPSDWVAASVSASAPHLRAGRPRVGGHHLDLGYGYQWWLPAGERADFSAIGVYNQFVYVDPRSATVVVKLSANRRYGTDELESTNREMETVALLRTVADVDG